MKKKIFSFSKFDLINSCCHFSKWCYNNYNSKHKTFQSFQNLLRKYLVRKKKKRQENIIIKRLQKNNIKHFKLFFHNFHFNKESYETYKKEKIIKWKNLKEIELKNNIWEQLSIRVNDKIKLNLKFVASKKYKQKKIIKKENLKNNKNDYFKKKYKYYHLTLKKKI